MKEDNDQEEIECRVCRGGDDDRPLYSPCKCSGSVGINLIIIVSNEW